MTYISPKRRFIQESIAEGCELDDALFLAELEFTEDDEIRPGSIYECYRRPS
jgi:hypothetical protein